jgi:hypothetical protein
MMEVVVFTAMVVALPGYVLGFALCRAAAQRDGGCEPAAIESLPYDDGSPLVRPRRATRRPSRCVARH